MPRKPISAGAHNVSPQDIPIQDILERFVCFVRDRKEDPGEWLVMVTDFKTCLKARKATP